MPSSPAGSSASRFSGMILSSVSHPEVPKRIDFHFAKQQITLGRISSNTPPCDVSFPKELRKIGRQHAWIERGGNEEYFLVDLGSVNHTFLNGKAITPNKKYHLSNGDEVAFSTEVCYRVVLH